MMHGRFRWINILITVACCAVLSAGWYFLHKRQKQAIHKGFLEQARRAEETANYKRAAQFLQHYLRINREDVDALERYGILLEDKLSLDKRALGVYESLLNLVISSNDLEALTVYGNTLKHGSTLANNGELADYERIVNLVKASQDVRLRAAKLRIKLKDRVSAAVKHLVVLQEANPANHEIAILLGNCKEIMAATKTDKDEKHALWDEAREQYERATKSGPHEVKSYEHLAALLRYAQKRPLDAYCVMEELVRCNKQNAHAYLKRAAFRLRGPGKEVEAAERPPLLGARSAGLAAWAPLGYGASLCITPLISPKLSRDTIGARDDLARAREIDPDGYEVLIASATFETVLAIEEVDNSRNHADQGLVYLKRAEELYPKHIIDILSMQSDLERLAGRSDNALDLLRRAHKQASRLDKADSTFDRDKHNRLLWTLANMLINEGDMTAQKQADEANAILNINKQNSGNNANLKFLEAKIAAKQNDYKKAIGILEQARPLMDKSIVVLTDLLLGDCFGKLGDTTKKVAMHRRACAVDPSNKTARLALVRTLAEYEKADEALRECEPLKAQMPEASVDEAFLYVRLLINKIRRTPRDELLKEPSIELINAANNVLQSVAKKVSKQQGVEVKTLQAELALAQGKAGEATKILTSAKADRPDQLGAWIALANLEARQGNTGEAVKILQEAELKLSNAKEPGIRGALLRNLAEAYELDGKWSTAEATWKKLTELHPKEGRIHSALFEFYSRRGNLKGMQDSFDQLKRIEKDSPLVDFANAQLLIHLASQRSSDNKQLSPQELEQLKKAQDLLERLGNKHPDWPQVQVGLAEIERLKGNLDSHIKHLEKAIELGNRQSFVIKSLYTRLIQSQRYVDAEKIRLMLGEPGKSADFDLQKLDAHLAVFKRDTDLALALARKAVPKDSTKYEDYLWQGQFLNSLERHIEAEKSLRMATTVAPENPRPWVVLVEFMAKRKRPIEDMEKEIAVMKLKVPAGELKLALAHCYQIMKKTGDAEKAFEDALKTQPDDLESAKELVELHLNNVLNRKAKVSEHHLRNAERSLRQLLGKNLKTSEEKRWVRRSLARVIGHQDNNEKHTEAIKLLDQNIEENLTAKPKRSTDEDVAVKGVLMGMRPESRKEGIKLLEGVMKQPSADEMFYLATLYDAEKDWRNTRARMLSLLETQTNPQSRPSPQKYIGYLVFFIDRLLAQKENDAAEVWLARLQEAIQDYLEIQDAAIFKSRIRNSIRLLSGLIRRHPEYASRILPENTTLRNFAKQTDKRESLLDVAEFLGRCQKLDEALDICDELRQELPPFKVLDVAVLSIAHNDASPRQLKRVEDWVDSARQRKQDLPEWDGYSALLAERQKRFGHAEMLYRKMLKHDPKNLNVTAANNLAFLLGLQGKGNEAHDLIEAAIKKAGPLDVTKELLDTRAVINRRQGKLRQAENDLQEALSEYVDVYRLFHLAEVYWAAERTKDAVETFGHALDLGLRPEMVHPLERESYQNLYRQHKQGN